MRPSTFAIVCLFVTRHHFDDAFCPTFTRNKRQIVGGKGFGDRSAALFMSPMGSSSISPERVKQVGGGIPIVPPGDFRVFNPEEEGKLQGTGELLSRIENGPNYARSPSPQSLATVESKSQVVDAQCWLEDIGVPLNYAKPQSPAIATVMGSARIIGEDASGDIKHVILRLPDGMHYVEGQSISVIPDGIDPATNRPFSPRLYSIASTRYGDLLDGQTVSLCVRRAQYYDPITNLPDPSKKGVCSNFLCDATKGKEVKVAGPVGKTMLLPEDCTADIIMIATGTGIAPFRSFLHRLFMEDTTANHLFQGAAWLVLGVPTTSGLLYADEFTAMQKRHGSEKFRLDYAISREMNNVDGGKLYVQHVIAQNADELFARLDNGANVYFCGLKGMMAPILDTLETAAASKNIIWADKLKELKANKQWHVEVY